MLSSVDIDNFRGIERGSLAEFSQLTVLVGPNGSGKSSVLEAIFASNDVAGNYSAILANRRQMGSVGESLKWIRRQGMGVPDQVMTVRTNRDDGSDSTLKLDWSGRGDGPPSQKTFPGSAKTKVDVRLVEPIEQLQQRPLVDTFTRVVERGALPEAKAIIQGLLPGVSDIQILAPQGQPTIYLVYPRGAIPLSIAGEGAKLLVRRAFELAAMPGGVVLLEEPETHLHPAGQRLLARAIWTAVRRGVQIILTTHSLDLIDSLLADATDDAELRQLSVFRLRLDGGVLRSTRISGPDAQLARSQIEDDLR